MANETKYYNGVYYQGNLDDDSADAILSLVSDYDSVPTLTHAIRNVPSFMIQDIIRLGEEYKAEHGSMKGFNHGFSTTDLGIGTLRPEQTVGVAFLYYAKSALLGDEVGLGKTVQIAGLCNVLIQEYMQEYNSTRKQFRYLFLTEKSSAAQIREKMIQFTGEFVDLFDSGEKKVIDKYIELNTPDKHTSFVGPHSLMLNPEFLTHMYKYPFDLVIVDESSIAKKSSSDFFVNCKAVFPRIGRIVLLNATPLELQLREMYNQLSLLDPDYMPPVGVFESKFVRKKKSHFGFVPNGFKNEEEFRESVMLRYLARTRQELGAEYKKNNYKVILCPLSAEQKVLSKKTSLHSMVVEYPTGADKRIDFNEHTTPKLAALLDLLEEEIKVYTNQVLIYCRYVEAQEKMKEILDELGYRTAILNGGRKTKERGKLAADYNRGDYDVMITNVLKGLDLSSCDTCIMYTIDPNPMKMVQFEGRMTRDFDVIYKSMFLLVSMGREKKFVEEKLKIRVEESESFTKTGNSMVLAAIKDGENREMYENSLLFPMEED